MNFAPSPAASFAFLKDASYPISSVGLLLSSVLSLFPFLPGLVPDPELVPLPELLPLLLPLLLDPELPEEVSDPLPSFASVLIMSSIPLLSLELSGENPVKSLKTALSPSLIP